MSSGEERREEENKAQNTKTRTRQDIRHTSTKIPSIKKIVI